MLWPVFFGQPIRSRITCDTMWQCSSSKRIAQVLSLSLCFISNVLKSFCKSFQASRKAWNAWKPVANSQFLLQTFEHQASFFSRNRFVWLALDELQWRSMSYALPGILGLDCAILTNLNRVKSHRIRWMHQGSSCCWLLSPLLWVFWQLGLESPADQIESSILCFSFCHFLKQRHLNLNLLLQWFSKFGPRRRQPFGSFVDFTILRPR